MLARYFQIGALSTAALAHSLHSQPTRASSGAPKVILPAAQQIAAAVLPAPAELRSTATVLGYGADGNLTTLRTGNGDVDSVRFREVRKGNLRMPKAPAVLYSLTGKAGSFDPATGTATGARHLFVVYVPNATPESLGLTAVPAVGTPWVMFPGTPKAHIMFVPKM